MERFANLSCSSARRRASLNIFSEREEGLVIGGFVGGNWIAGPRGDVGVDFEWGFGRELGGDKGRDAIIGVGVWIWMDIANVGCARCGTRPRLMRKATGDNWEGVELRGTRIR